MFRHVFDWIDAYPLSSVEECVLGIIFILACGVLFLMTRTGENN